VPLGTVDGVERCIDDGHRATRFSFLSGLDGGNQHACFVGSTYRGDDGIDGKVGQVGDGDRRVARKTGGRDREQV
jgi:hypothetical protein